MKRYLFFLFLWIKIFQIAAQSLYVGGSYQIPMRSGGRSIATGIKIDFPLSRLISLGVDLDLATGEEIRHNVMYRTSIDLSRWFSLDLWRLKASGGIGWGHYYTNAVTDHNYHTYRIGMLVERKVEHRLSLFISPSLNSRSYAEHIGFSTDRAWFQLEIGFCYDICVFAP